MNELDATIDFTISIETPLMTFGHTTDNSNGTLSSLTNINASFYQMTTDGTILKMTAKIGTTSGTGSIKCAIYDSTRHLIATTETITASGAFTWADLYFTTQPTLPAGGYWLAIWSDDSHMECRARSITPPNMLATWAPFNGWPSTLNGTPITPLEMLIYCTYQP